MQLTWAVCVVVALQWLSCAVQAFTAVPIAGCRACPRQHQEQEQEQGDRGGGQEEAGGGYLCRYRAPRGPATRLHLAKKNGYAPKQKGIRVEVDDAESEAWKLAPILEAIRNGGVGIIPTETCYVFATDLHSRQGVDRIFSLKNMVGQKKPLSLLCKDISTIAHYTSGLKNKATFKTLKALLPGPYTFVLLSTSAVPKVLLEHKTHKKAWKRREIGVRIPNHPVLLELLKELDGPLLCSSVPVECEEEEGEWGLTGGGGEEGVSRVMLSSSDGGMDLYLEGRGGDGSGGGREGDGSGCGGVDFVLDAGPIHSGGGVTTVLDATGPNMVLLRQGLGEVDRDVVLTREEADAET